MLTKQMLVEILEEIKNLKDGVVNPSYYRIEKAREVATIATIVTILLTPLTILLDLVTLPLQLIYLIVYKLLWKN